MNTLQQILVILLKVTHYPLFKGSVPDEIREASFINAFINSGLVNLKIRIMKDKTFILTWDSAIGSTVAFPLTDNEFFFSRIRTYDKKSRSLGDKIMLHVHNDHESQITVEYEVAKIKQIFMSYSIDAQNHFK